MICGFDECGAPFEPVNTSQRYCSPLCKSRVLAKKRRNEVIAKNAKKDRAGTVLGQRLAHLLECERLGVRPDPCRAFTVRAEHMIRASA